MVACGELACTELVEVVESVVAMTDTVEVAVGSVLVAVRVGGVVVARGTVVVAAPATSPVLPEPPGFDDAGLENE